VFFRLRSIRGRWCVFVPRYIFCIILYIVIFGMPSVALKNKIFIGPFIKQLTGRVKTLGRRGGGGARTALAKSKRAVQEANFRARLRHQGLASFTPKPKISS
jgi:hypothetical protein